MSIDHHAALDSLTEALIDANDQLLALYDMTVLQTDTLDEHESVEQILDKARVLLRTEDLRLLSGDDAERPDDGRITTSVRVQDPSGGSSTLIAKRTGTPFTTGDTKLLTAVAHLAMSAQHRARMHAAAVEQAIVSHEHTMASELAQRALPARRPDLPGAGLFARTDPARLAGGDLFTFALVDSTFHFVVGDVSGKGLPAAMMMSNVINAAKSCFKQFGPHGPAAVLEGIDGWVYEALSDADMFVTLITGQFDVNSRVLSLANAGHSPVYFVHDGVASPVPASRPPIGVLPGLPCDRLDLTVGPGDLFVAASDGFPEQADPSGEMFGDARFERALASRSASIEDFGGALFAMVEEFAAEAPQSDDRTLFVLDFGTQA